MAGIHKLPTLVHLFKPHAAFSTNFTCKLLTFQNRKISSNSLKMALNPNHIPEIQEPSAKIQKIHDHNGVSEAKPTAIAPFLRVKRLSEKAVLPSRGSPLSAGYDLSRYAFFSPCTDFLSLFFPLLFREFYNFS